MNKSEFQQRISESNRPIIVDFWADWCIPCKMTKPVLEKLGNEFAEKVEFMSVNADDSPEVVEQFKVMSIPTVVTLKNGNEIRRTVGAQSEKNYRDLFQAASEGTQVKKSISQLDRSLRLGAGALLIMEGFSSHNWIVFAIGGVIAFLGIYDRCPIWKALTGMFKRS
jgi:thioredoxin 1